MQRCKNCSTQFKWKAIIKSMWNYYAPVECDKCKTKHSISFIYRCILASSCALPLLFREYLFILGKSYFMFIYIAWITIMICISPFYLSYNNKNKVIK
ncbi:TIGR04104 family putative zinc finger protein [Clostridium tagluense]|uniref:TIGR04104 family putative zinc finger protein n=1 Tax=Clostridium tagluense TaxID=360422 RepID=UPI0034E23C52